MGGLLERSRNLVGAGLVKLGLAVLGYKSPPADDPSRDADYDDEGLPPNVAPAVLSDAAREMIAGGTPGWSAPRNEPAPPPLTGSLADRRRTARREMGR